MKPVITFLMFFAFAGFVMAQNAPQQAPPAGHKVVAQDKSKEKQHHRHHHEHKPGEGKK